MNNTIFEEFRNTRPHLTILINYYNIRTKSNRIICLVRKLEEYPILSGLNRVSDVLGRDDFSEKEEQVKEALRGFKGKDKFIVKKNNMITHESSLSDVKSAITIYLREPDILNASIHPEELFIEQMESRRPLGNYKSGINLLELDVSRLEIDDKNYDTVNIDDILLNNLDIVDNLLKLNVYLFSDYVDAIREERSELIRESEKKLFKTLNNYWIQLEVRNIENRFKRFEYLESFLETKEKDYNDKKVYLNSEGEFNEVFWKANINDYLFKNLGIYFNSFILENKENLQERKIDIYSVFKYFELDASVPFSRYSYGGQLSQKIVKIYENFYSIENVKFLEKWNSVLSYRDTPSNCVQWKGFYNYNDDTTGETSILEYEIILYNDGLYQIRLYQQKINLVHIETFLEFIKSTLLEKIKKILYGIGIHLVLNKLELGKNVHFIFSKLEIAMSLKSDIELGKLQNILTKSTALFSKTSELISNEFINLEFKKVDNYTRTDQIQKYINHYIIQNRVTEGSDLGPLVKQVMAKYSKNQVDAMKLVKTWVTKFVDSDTQKANKIKIGRNIGLEVVGKQVGSDSCNFYMSNITTLKDIFTFFYYLIVLVNISQLKENVKIYNEIIGRRSDEKIIAKIEDKKEKEQIVDTGTLGDLDDLVFEDVDDDYIFQGEDPIDEVMSVHEGSQEELIAVEKESVTGEESELPQEEMIDELQPILNGSSYYIKRLQLMDKEVYDYKVDSKFKPYSKKAMPNDSRQPIVLTNRQMDKIKAKYGADVDVYGGLNRRIDVYSKDYKAPAYSIKYRNLHYICPKVWCMFDQLPYYMDQLLEPGTSNGFAKVGKNEKGEFLVNPTKVKCPDCGHGVWGYDKDGTLLIAQDNLKRQPYPGFFTGEQHPKNLCMVTCFKTPNKKLDECLGSEKPVKKEKKITNEKYILKGDKYGICNNGRFCVLPDKLHNWINADFGNYKLERTIIDEFISYLRKGILKENEEYYQSFEKTIQYLLGDSIFKLSKDEFREFLINKFKSIPDIDSIFKKVRKGSLYLYFGKNIENYYTYIKEAISLQPKFIIPILSHPSIITENGVNFFILREENDRIFLECEYFNYEFINLNEKADNMFIYSHSLGETYKKTYYEPIVLVQQKSKSLQVAKSINGSNRIVTDLLKYVRTECSEKEDPWITQLKKSRINKPGLLEEEYFLNKQDSEVVLNSIEETGEFQIIQQFVNDYNQTEGLIVKWITKETKFYIPIQPIQILDSIRTIKHKQLIRLNSFDDTKEFLTAFSNRTNLFYTPYAYTLNMDKLISGIYTITGLWIPVLYTALESANIEGMNEWKFSKDIWFEKKISTDDRLVNKRFRDTNKYNYEKLRFELSKSIKMNDELKEQIMILMRQYKTSLPIERKQQIRKSLQTILSNHLRSTLVIPGAIGEWNIKDVFSYCGEYKTLMECNSGSMCKWDETNNECKVLINPEWYWKYVSRIVDDLLVNVNKKKEIVEEYRKELELPENEKIFYSKDEIDDYLEKYDFNLENKKYIQHPLEHFSYSNPYKQAANVIAQVKTIDTRYSVPKYILYYFQPSIGPSKPQVPKDIALYQTKEVNYDYFFNNMAYLVKTLPRKSKPIRFELANRIREEVNSAILLERYRALSEQPNGDLYRKFRAMKSIEALADYIKERSWGNIIDLELLADIYSQYRLRFIILEDDGNPNRTNIFVHLPNHLKGMTLENKDEYVFGIFVLHDNIFELLIRKNNPLFKANDIPFLSSWYESQLASESSMPY